MGVRVGAHAWPAERSTTSSSTRATRSSRSTAPREIVGKTLAEAEVRGRYGITVVCVKPADGAFTYATPDTVVQEGDVLVVAGETARAESFSTLT